MLIQELKENEWGQVNVFQDIYFESSQMHLLTMMYCFEHANHDIS